MSKIRAFALSDRSPVLRAAPVRRSWMDAFPDRHAYRCLPLSMANSYGWELLCTHDFAMIWNGGPDRQDLRFKPLDGMPYLDHFVCSNFSHGIATFHTGYIFRTDPGTALMATGPLNAPKHGAAPLSGLIETSWLPYPFTMNWQMTAPGRVEFRKGEPFCTLVPVGADLLRDVTVDIHAIDSDPGLKADMEAWGSSRASFLARLERKDEGALHNPWQRFYFLGKTPDGAEAEGHSNRLKLAEPVDRRGTDMKMPG